MIDTIAIGCDNLIEWREPCDKATGAFIGADATGSVAIKDAAGNIVGSATSYVAAYSAGPPRRYQATIPRDVPVVEGTTYYIEFTLTSGDGTVQGFRRWDVVAAYKE